MSLTMKTYRNLPSEVNIRVTILLNGSFFIASDQIKDAFLLKRLLFAWHEPSFYGATIQTIMHNNKHGVLLSPYMAMQYLSRPRPVKHLQLTTGNDVKVLQRIARFYFEAVCQEWFKPDFHRFLEGGLAWKLTLPDQKREEWAHLAAEAEQHDISHLEVWFSHLLSHMAKEDATQRKLRAASDRVTQLLPKNSQDGKMLNHPFVDEEEWLVLIGWASDSAPFRVGLKLLEPAQDANEWELRCVFQDKSSSCLTLECKADGTIPANLPQSWEKYAQDKLTSEIRRWMNIVPDLLLKRVLNEEEAWHFLAVWSPQLARYGCLVILPEWWEKAQNIRPRLKGSMRTRQEVTPAGTKAGTKAPAIGLRQMLEFDWSIAVGDVELDKEDFEQWMRSGKRLIRSGGQWVGLSPDVANNIRKALRQIQDGGGLGVQEVLYRQWFEQGQDFFSSSAKAGGDEAEPGYLLELKINTFFEEMILQLQDAKSIPAQPVPPAFHGELRPYQQEGLSWLLFLRRFGLGACLADDMGLGKTIQWISYVLSIKREAPTLLICPTSVLGNWQKEFERFAPTLNLHLHYGQNRKKGAAFQAAAQAADVVLTSYQLAYLDENEFCSLEWDAVCLDEAQQIKNSYTKQSQAVRSLAAKHKVALTGTPIENRLQELWSIFDFINPGYLGSQQQFQQRYVHPIEAERNPERIKHVQRLVQPFLLRRMKRDPAIQLHLPDKHEMKCYVSLTPLQGTLYEQVLEQLFTKVDRVSAMERRGIILSSITKLKQICDHPYLFLRVKHVLSADEILQESFKMSRLVEMIQSLRDNGESCLVFTQYIGMGHLLQQAIEDRLGEPVSFMHGGVSKAGREQMISQFQAPDAQAGVLILSLKAGGTGLNLTAANHVFHVDRWWNPAVENQATDRTYRIGQTKNVQVYKFVTLGTLEEKIDEMLEQKQGLSEQIMDAGKHWLTELTAKELRAVLSLR